MRDAPESVRRLAAFLNALTGDWESAEWLLAALSDYYPERADTASRMLARDVRWLRGLGFIIERSAEHHDPHYRVAGHVRFGAEQPAAIVIEVPSKWCARCRRWQPLTAFAAERRRGGRIPAWCIQCRAKKNGGAS